jgi:hypothetical protein
MMTIELPYQFDTMALPRNILKGFVAGSTCMILFALAMSFKYGPLAAVPLLMAAALLAWTASKMMTGFPGYAKGTITQDAVIVEPSGYGPLKLQGLAGRYRLDQFTAVRVVYLGPRRNQSYQFADIFLVGFAGTSDICIANERDITAKALAPALAAVLSLPLEQVGLAPFDH